MTAAKKKAAAPIRKITKTRPRRTLRVAHGEGKEALFQAVVRSVVHHGPSGISNRAVAKEAGVSHGLIRYHFGSQNEMLTETFRWVLDNALGSLTMQASESGLAEWVLDLASMPEDEAASHLFMNEMVLEACRVPARRHLVLPTFRQSFRAMETALKDSGVPTTPALARVIFAAIVGLTIQQLVFRQPKMSRESALEFGRVLNLLRDQTRD